jgi:hypothetical protein
MASAIGVVNEEASLSDEVIMVLGERLNGSVDTASVANALFLVVRRITLIS